jgi:hypothetical protein
MRLRVLALLACSATLLSAGAAHAATKVVTFDNLAHGTTVATQYAASAGVSFTQPTDPGYAPVIREAVGQAHSGNNVADIETCVPSPCGEFAGVPDTRGELSTTATSVSVYVGEFGSAPASADVELIGYTAQNAVVQQTGPVVVTEGAGFGTRLEVSSSTPDIAYFDVKDPEAGQFGSPVAIDDLTIVTPATAQPPDFTLSPGLGVLDVLQGQSQQDPLSISRINGSTGNVTFTASGLPTGMSATFSPNPLTGTETNTTMTVTAATGAAAATAYSTATITATPVASAGSTPRSVTTQARISENCAKTVRFPYVDLRSEGCLRKEGTTTYVAENTDVHVDGLVLHPLEGEMKLTIDPTGKTIKSPLNARYSVSVLGDPDLPFYDGPIDWSFKNDTTLPVPGSQNTTGKPKQVLGLDISGVKLLQGIPLTGVSAVFTESGKAVVTPTLKLEFFPFNYFGPLTVSGSFTTDNDHGAEFSGFEIKVPEVDVLAMQIKEIDLKYQGSETWSGSAKVVLDFADHLTIGAGFGIKQGHFAFLKGSVGNLNTAIATGVFLQGLAFEVSTAPTTLKGQITLSAGPSIAGKTALSFDGSVTAVLADPWILEVDGDAKLAEKLELGSAFLRFSSAGLFEFGGKAHWELSVVSIEGSVAGWAAGLHNFDVEGAVKGCVSLEVYTPCAAAKALVSNLGIAACVEVLGEGVGVGSHWGEDFDAFTGCDLGPWRPTKPTAETAATAEHFQIPAGLPSLAWSIDGAGGIPPDVTVTGPGGETVALTQAAPYVSNGQFFAGEAVNGTTYVVVKNPPAGAWTVSATGAVPITRIRQANGLPKPSVTAKVTGKGRARGLQWHLKPEPGQVVRFAEIGKDVRRVIGSATSAHGSLHFRPADAPAGVRKIEAIVEQDGRPRTTLPLTSYIAPGPPTPGRTAGLKLTRKGLTVTVRWAGHPSGLRHAVYLTISDGRKLLRLVPSGHSSVAVGGVGSTVSVTASVMSLSAGNSKGPAAHVTLKGIKKHKKKKKGKPGH